METSYKIHHGQNIRFIRQSLNLSQQDVADKSGINRKKISNLENQIEIDEDNINIIASALNCAPELIKSLNREKALKEISNNTFNQHDNSKLVFSESFDENNYAGLSYEELSKILLDFTQNLINDKSKLIALMRAVINNTENDTSGESN